MILTTVSLIFFFPCRIQFNYHHWLAILFDLSLDREHWLWLTINITVLLISSIRNAPIFR